MKRYLVFLVLTCLVSAVLSIAAVAVPLTIDQVVFSKGTSSGAAIHVIARNDSATAQTITGIKVNGTLRTNSDYAWWRAWPATLQPGEVSTVTVVDRVAPLVEGTTNVSVEVLVTGGSGATQTGITLTTPKIRLGNVLISKDMLTVNIYVRNLDTVSYTINSVYLNGDVTAQCVFPHGTTVAAQRVAIIEVPYASVRTLLTSYAVRVIATKSGGGAIAVAAPVRLVRPWFGIGTWSSWLPAYNSYGNLGVNQFRGIRQAKDLQIDDCNGINDLIQVNGVFTQWGIRGVSDYQLCKGDTTWRLIQSDACPAIFGWKSCDEKDNGPTGTCNGMNDVLDSIASIRANCHYTPSFVNFAQATSVWLGYGLISDIVCWDNNSAKTGATSYNRTNTLKLNCEPLFVTAWTSYDNSTFSTRVKKWVVNWQAWGQIMLGAKGIRWFKFGGAATDDWYTKYPLATAGALQTCRELSQVRNLLMYSDVSNSVTVVTSPTGKGDARALVGKDQVVAVLMNLRYYSQTLSAITGNITVPVPSTIPINKVYKVTETGFTELVLGTGYTIVTGGVNITFSMAAGDAGQATGIYVIGRADTEAPGQPVGLKVAQVGFNGANTYTLSWSTETFDNVGVKGYKVYKDGVYVTDVRYEMYDTPAVTAGCVYTVKAFDSSGNLSAASLGVECTPYKWTLTQTDPSDARIPQFDGEALGWGRGENTAYMKIAGGSLGINSLPDNGDPWSYGPGGLQMPAASYNNVTIRMKNGTAGTTGMLSWMTTLQTSFANYMTFTIVANDTVMRDYVVPVGTNGGWTGTIHKLRLDQTDASGHVDIESIIFGYW